MVGHGTATCERPRLVAARDGIYKTQATMMQLLVPAQGNGVGGEKELFVSCLMLIFSLSFPFGVPGVFGHGFIIRRRGGAEGWKMGYPLAGKRAEQFTGSRFECMTSQTTSIR